MILCDWVFFELQSVTLHTNVGELKCEIYCDEVPKAAEVRARSSLKTCLCLLDAPSRWFCNASMNPFSVLMC